MKNSHKHKKVYRIRNWSEYNNALVQRGSITFWVGEDAIGHWINEGKTGLKGASEHYSDVAIETMLTLQAIFCLTLRSVEGFVDSLFGLMKLDLAVPDYTTLCRRRQNLKVELPVKKRPDRLHVVVDSSGIKIYGEGEWKVRQHGWSKRRTWRKLHLAVDESTQEILSMKMTDSRTHDGQVLAPLLAQIQGKISEVSADGAYDQRRCYDVLEAIGAYGNIPPRRNARLWKPGHVDDWLIRDNNLRWIWGVGRKRWKEESDYHRRSLAETSLSRYKRLFGDRIKSRLYESQGVDLRIRCKMLNQMRELGMPDSYRVEA